MATTDYNIIGETARPLTAAQAEQVMDDLGAYHPAVGRSARGGTEVIITVPATGLEQAVTTGVRLLAGVRPVQVEALTTSEYDRRAADVRMPDLIGATEAARILGVTRQRIQQMAQAGDLPAQIVGRSLVLPRLTVERRARADA